ncbi:hypothetical protein NDU88_006264 [Pleurodeles waltl]|uniref:Uncharacterized protein n=1 Tax=Pleurodeles waltl TaxID=8319 RepID=A0AAV7X167_PLEWA|nr:hypothetical protein NDU88_006264 [Pleurodeles waltl]
MGVTSPHTHLPMETNRTEGDLDAKRALPLLTRGPLDGQRVSTDLGFRPAGHSQVEWNGLDEDLRFCQDRLLDVVGPLTKIFDMTEEAYVYNKRVDVEELQQWIQRAHTLTAMRSLDADCCAMTIQMLQDLLRNDSQSYYTRKRQNVKMKMHIPQTQALHRMDIPQTRQMQ